MASAKAKALVGSLVVVGVLVGIAAAASASPGEKKPTPPPPPKKPPTDPGDVVDVEIEEPGKPPTVIPVDVPDGGPATPAPSQMATLWPGQRYRLTGRITPGSPDVAFLTAMRHALAATGATDITTTAQHDSTRVQYVMEPDFRIDVPLNRQVFAAGEWRLSVTNVEHLGAATGLKAPEQVAPPTGSGPAPSAPEIPVSTSPVPSAPGVDPGDFAPPTEIAEVETDSYADPNGTVGLARVMLARESAPGWKDDLQEDVKEWQRTVGLVADGKFGVNSVTRMAREVGILPLVRFWSLGQHWNKETAIADYRKRINGVIEELKKIPGTEAHRRALAASIEREDAQGSFPVPQPVPVQEQVNKIMERLDREDDEEARLLIERMV